MPPEMGCEDAWRVLVIAPGSPGVRVEDCGRAGMRCEAGACVGCLPGASRCQGDTVLACAADGLTFLPTEDCALPGRGCVAGRCRDLCAAAREDASYLGCDYHAVTTLNSLLPDGFELGVVVANPSSREVHVRITRGELEERVTLPPGGTEAVRLPMVPELTDARWGSVLLSGGSYEVRSDGPIAAYQYDPLEFRRDPSCVFTGTTEDLGCFSFTNDASLLLPDHAVGTDYLVDTRGGRSGAGASFVTVVAIEDTSVEVQAPTALLGSMDGGLGTWPAGAPRTLALAAGDVLQLVAEGDLGGAEVHADRPVLVFAGHDCANVPERFRACDHLEEVMLPLDTWGHTAVVAVPRVVPDEPVVVRILSAVDGNTIEVSTLAQAFTLDRGERFELTTTADLIVEGSGPILVTEYMVGAARFDRGGGRGDPSMGTAPFVAQFRTRYDFAVPSTYTDDFAAIVAFEGDDVRMDGRPIDAWEALPPFVVARVRMSPGTHRLEASRGAGLTLYGVAPFTSYLLPGGLDVEPLR